MEGLRAHLFSVLAAVQDKKEPLDLAVAKSVCEISGQILATARVEVDFLRFTGKGGSGKFLDDQVNPTRNNDRVEETSTGVRRISSVAGGSITEHKMR